MGKYKSWREKLENPPKGLPKVENGPAGWAKTFGGRKVLIATPLLVDELVKKVPEGKLVTIRQIRESLSKKFKADSTCPLTTGIFLRIVAETSEEDRKNGRQSPTPYWRVIRENGSLIDKFSGAPKLQSTYLKKEGHSIDAGNKTPKVVDFEKSLVKL